MRTQFADLKSRDTSLIPPTGNFPGMVLLGFLTPGSENLDTGMPLSRLLHPHVSDIHFLSAKRTTPGTGLLPTGRLGQCHMPTIPTG